MGLRTRIADWLGIDDRIRDFVRREFASRSLPSATELEELRSRVDALDKKVKMTMGTVQASTAQLMGVHDSVDSITAAVKKNKQLITTAKSTAESTADGLEALEEQVAALMERIAATA